MPRSLRVERGAEERAGAEGDVERAASRPLHAGVAEHEPEGPDDQLEQEREGAEEPEQRVGEHGALPPRERAPRDPDGAVDALRDARVALHAARQEERDEELREHERDEKRSEDPDDDAHGRTVADAERSR